MPYRLNRDAEEKLSKISMETGLSKTEIIHHIIASLSTFELSQIVTLYTTNTDQPKPRKLLTKKLTFVSRF
jgi:uncharacterized protein YidB (DUF937 family)